MDLKREVAVIWAVFGLLGCHAHVTLQAPRTDAPLEERAKAYEQLKPLSAHERVLFTVQGGVATPVASTPTYVQLNNGERVYYPEDLLPVVAPDSVAAKAAIQSESARGTLTIIQGIGYGLAAVAVAVGLGLILGMPDAPSPTIEQVNTQSNARMLALGVLIGGASVGGLIALIGGWVFGNTVTDAARTTFETYDFGLRARLSLAPETSPRTSD